LGVRLLALVSGSPQAIFASVERKLTSRL